MQPVSVPMDNVKLPGFVGAVIVQDNVNDLAGRYLILDGIEEADELLMAVALHAAADNPAVDNIDRTPRLTRHNGGTATK